MDITTIGFDLAKTVFQVHGADGEGRVVLRRKLRRGKVLAFFAGLPPCLVGMEACASAHYWARELQALGHKVRLIPPQYVRPFVKTNKNDAADAEAICEAVTRPTMRFAPAKSAEQQSVLMLHRARELLVRQRTMVINALRGHCAELGLIVAQGASRVEVRWRRAKPGTRPGWTDQLLARRPTNVVLVAMANKTARVAWALLRYERIYRPTPA